MTSPGGELLHFSFSKFFPFFFFCDSAGRPLIFYIWNAVKKQAEEMKATRRRQKEIRQKMSIKTARAGQKKKKKRTGVLSSLLLSALSISVTNRSYIRAWSPHIHWQKSHKHRWDTHVPSTHLRILFAVCVSVLKFCKSIFLTAFSVFFSSSIFYNAS